MAKKGRPTKYRAEYAEQAYKLALVGATDKQIADFFAVNEATLTRWKRSHEDFCTSLKKGKRESDEAVVKSLRQRALGYAHPEDKIFCNADGDVTTVPTTKHYPPDVTACIFWLKNRQPNLWRDRHELTGAEGEPLDITVKVKNGA